VSVGHALLIWFTEWPHENQKLTNFVDSSFLRFSAWKGITMRIFTASVIIAAVSLGTPAFVQAQGSTLAIQGTDTVCSIQHGHSDHTGRRPQGTATGGALEGPMTSSRRQARKICSHSQVYDATPEAASALKAKA